MNDGKAMALLLAFFILALGRVYTLAQSQTTGRITGTVKDLNGSVIAGATVTVARQCHICALLKKSVKQLRNN